MILNVVVIIECDKCGTEESYELQRLDDRELKGILEGEDWSVGSNPHGHYMHCPDCTAKEED